MDIRSVYWALCGAGATLLTSAWGSKQAMLLPQNQETNVAPVAQATFGLPQSVTNTGLLVKRQPWAEAKSDPFAKASPIEQKVIAPVADKVVTPQPQPQLQPQPPSFPYVFIGRLQAEEKDSVFLTKDNQIYSIAAGDTVDGAYRIERVGSNELEITYLPDQQKLTVSFDAMVLKPVQNTGAAPPRAGAPTGGFLTPPVLPKGMAGEALGRNIGQMAENLKQALTPSPTHQADAPSMAGAAPPPVLPVEMAGAVSAKNSGQATESLRLAMSFSLHLQGGEPDVAGAAPSPVLSSGAKAEMPGKNIDKTTGPLK